jgi:hypothetical protein
VVVVEVPVQTQVQAVLVAVAMVEIMPRLEPLEAQIPEVAAEAAVRLTEVAAMAVLVS